MTLRYFTRIQNRQRKGDVSGTAVLFLFIVMVLIIAGAVFIVYSSFSNQLTVVQGQVNSDRTLIANLQNQTPSNLPVMNQAPQVRNFKVEWTNALNSGQDRFFVPSIIVNQGDTVRITFVSNDTDAHTFTLELPYAFQINATVPGTRDYLSNGTVFTTNATNNSPGVKVWGTPGNVTATGSFVAKYPGIFEYFCIYHVSLGMFGYMIVLPNEAFTSGSNSSSGVTPSTSSSVDIAPGSSSNQSSSGFTPSIITVVIGINNTVIWTNKDSTPHTVTANDGSFSSGNLNAGDTYQFTFTQPGSYSYHCSYHPWMTGTIIVKQANS
jgi:plastocyanin